jgi:hypothetical protein
VNQVPATAVRLFVLAVVAFASSSGKALSAAKLDPNPFDGLTGKVRERAIDEATALSFIWFHVHNADETAHIMLREMSKPTGEPSGALSGYAKTFSSEVKTALIECDLIDAGVENRISDQDYESMERAADLLGKLDERAGAAKYRKQLGFALDTLHQTAKLESAKFRETWGFEYRALLRGESK